MPPAIRCLIVATLLAVAALPACAQRGSAAAAPADAARQKVEQLRRAVEMRGREQAGAAAIESACRVRRDGTTEPVRCLLYDIGATVPGHLDLRGVQLPAEPSLLVLAITLAGAGEAGDTCVDLARYADIDAVAVPGTPADGGMDGNGHALPADLFVPADEPSTATTFRAGGVVYLRPRTDAGVPNAVEARGQVLRLPAGRYSRVHVLAAAARGGVHSRLIFRFRATGMLATQNAQHDFHLPDCAVPAVETADAGTSPLLALAQLVRMMGGAQSLSLPPMRVQLGLGARADTQDLDGVTTGMSWAGEKTETTFTCIADVREMLPGVDFSSVRVVLYANVDDGGALYVDGRRMAEFRAGEGSCVLLDGKAPSAPFAIGIGAYNDTGRGQLVDAGIRVEQPAYADYLALIEELQAAENRHAGQPAMASAVARVRARLFASLPVEAIVRRDHARLAAAVRQLRADVRELSAPARKRARPARPAPRPQRQTPEPNPWQEW